MGGTVALRACLATLTTVLLASPFFVGSSEAHTPTALAASNPTVCVGAGGSLLTPLYSAVTPTDRDWTVRARIGLSGGDTVSPVWFQFYMYDNAWSTTEPTANWGEPAGQWLTNPGYAHQGTLEIHAGGSMTFNNVIISYDSVSQCFTLYARAFYSTD